MPANSRRDLIRGLRVKAVGVYGESRLLRGASVIDISVPHVLKDPGLLILRMVHMVTIVL